MFNSRRCVFSGPRLLGDDAAANQNVNPNVNAPAATYGAGLPGAMFQGSQAWQDVQQEFGLTTAQPPASISTQVQTPFVTGGVGLATPAVPTWVWVVGALGIGWLVLRGRR